MANRDDAPTRTVRVEVRQDCIDLGAPECGETCPVHLALEDAGVEHCHVDRSFVCFGDGDEVDLPKDAADFIRAFDNGEDVEPFSFEIEVPQ